MSNAVRKLLPLDAFLAWEREQDLRYEFDGSEPVAMTGGRVAHSEIGTALVEALRRRLKGQPCRALRGDLKVNANGRVRYPDATVTCAPLDNHSDLVSAPVIVFEIISPSTASTERITRNEAYRLTPSIQHYMMLEQMTQAATVLSRIGDAWLGGAVTHGAALAVPEIGVELPLAEIYAGLDLAAS